MANFYAPPRYKPVERLVNRCCVFLPAGFGFLGDYLGRRIMFITTAFLCICGNIASGLVGFGYRVAPLKLSVFHQLAIVRFFLGIGIGGEVSNEALSFLLGACLVCATRAENVVRCLGPIHHGRCVSKHAN